MLSEAVTKEQIQIPPEITGAVRIAAGADVGSAIGAVTMGFSADPVARWMYPDPADYLRWFPSFINAFAGRSFEAGTAYITSDGIGAALWLPPGTGPDDEALVSIALDSTSGRKQSELMALFEAMDDAHPEEPHWYLPMIGVDTPAQEKGIGSKLMRYALERADADGLPAYLESSNPRNISLYRRFGFEVAGTIQVGSCPPLFPMLRKPI